MKVGDLVKIRHDSSTLGLVIDLGDRAPEPGSPITYRVWVAWNYLDVGMSAPWNWQLEVVSESR